MSTGSLLNCGRGCLCSCAGEVVSPRARSGHACAHHVCVQLGDVAVCMSTRECQVLEGHRNNVRALAWSHEVPFWLLSGSWDGSIRLWDTRSGACIKVRFPV